jgi:hypothetical protein
VLAVPGKRHDHATMCFLTREEAGALLAAPVAATWAGRRDHALLTVGAQAGAYAVIDRVGGRSSFSCDVPRYRGDQW